MANSNFELDLAAGAKHTAQAHEVLNDLRNTLKTITNEVDQARASWVGDAFNAFQQSAQEWDAEAGRLNQKLNDLQETLSGTVFKGSDHANQDVAASFKNAHAGGGLNL